MMMMMMMMMMINCGQLLDEEVPMSAHILSLEQILEKYLKILNFTAIKIKGYCIGVYRK